MANVEIRVRPWIIIIAWGWLAWIRGRVTIIKMPSIFTRCTVRFDDEPEERISIIEAARLARALPQVRVHGAMEAML